ncbi:MAG: M48 family metalloprotease [Myxococcota bacterium]
MTRNSFPHLISATDRRRPCTRLLLAGALIVFCACASPAPPSSQPASAPSSAPSSTPSSAPSSASPSGPSSAAPASADESASAEDAAESQSAQSAQPSASPGEESDSDAPRDGDAADGNAPEDEGEGKGEKKTERPKRIVLDTVYDDRRVGNDQTEQVEAELGLVDDPKLERYVRDIAIRLLRYAPTLPFDWEFKIVDQTVPNAFALPGGKIYVSRGLLALVETEDELAGVLGHEITHSAERHAAARIEQIKRLNPFTIGLFKAAKIAAYGRDQERDADRGGQILAAKAGYDPIGIATFLRKLDAAQRYEVGGARIPHFLATHPTSPERSALASDRSTSLTWKPVPPVSAGQPYGYYSMVDGLIIGEDPAGGLFQGERFIHPELRFTLRFPSGWKTLNSVQAVRAVSPEGNAQASLTVEGRSDELEKVVEDFLDREVDGMKVRVHNQAKIRIGELPAIRIQGTASGPGPSLAVQMTFVAYGELVYRLSVLSLPRSASSFRGRARAFAKSFRPLDEAESYSLEVTRLRLARALENETLDALSDRTQNELEIAFTGVMNAAFPTTRLRKGRVVKIGLPEPYLPKPREEEPEP